MSLPPEKLSELRQLIHSRVSQLGVQEQIRGFLTETQEGGSRCRIGVRRSD